MVGVARVYKVKQEIFMTDITNCVASLKKVFQDSPNSGYAMNTHLQMTQPSVRPSALTLVADPRTQFTLDFDALVADWDEYLNIHGDTSTDDADDDFDPKTKRNKQKAPTSLRTEVARGEIHTLTEHHEHLLSASFDLSYHGSGGDPGHSSSQVDADFGFDINFLNPPSDGLLDFGGLGDELERELGWGPSQAENKELDLDDDFQMDVLGSDMNFDFEVGQVPTLIDTQAGMSPIHDATAFCALQKTPQSLKRKKTLSDSDKENCRPSPLLPHSPATSFSYQLLSQDEHMHVISTKDHDQGNPITLAAAKKAKRTRLLLDARTELTDDELKTARAQYLQAQDFVRQEMTLKYSERHKGRMIEEMVWGVPNFIQAPALVDFWQENFKVQVDARSGTLRIHLAEEPPRKRRRTKDTPQMNLISITAEGQADTVGPMSHGDGMDIDIAAEGQYWDANLELELDHIRSSEEPGQGRRASRPPSYDIEFDLGTPRDLLGSQKSSLFPWDNAGMSSSSGAPRMPGSDQIYVDPVELKLRGSSQSRRSSPLIPSQFGSIAEGFSPAPVRQSSQALPEDYVFETLEKQDVDPRLESQRSDVTHISLERNSFNFLEYARMQWQSLPSSASSFTFDTVVPQATSTRHVAAAALYHCLVLATKDLLRLDQYNPYGPVSIVIV